jgi:uroporphyrinogen decarboxylase
VSALTGRERLLRVFRGQPADRIPIAPFIHVNYVKEFHASHDVDCAARTPDVYRHFGFDLIHRNCTPVYDAVGPSAPGWQLEVEKEQNGRDKTTITHIRTPGGNLRCIEALRWVYEYDAESASVEYLIKSEADLDHLVRFQPPPGPADVSDLTHAKVGVGEEGVVAPWIQGAFNLVAFYYRKLSDLVMDALLRPPFYACMMDYLLGRYKAFVQEIIDAGVDVLSYAGNIANAKLVSPAFFHQHIWPYERALIDFVQDQGVIVLYHNCGCASRLLPLYAELGMRAYESLTPPPYGDTALEEAVDLFGGRTTLSGNIDQLDLLRHGSSAEIDVAVRQTLDAVRGRAPFILATTDYFNEDTPHDSIHALADAGRRHGWL